MLRRIILAGLLIFVAGIGAGARAQEGAAEEKRRDIKRLLQLIKVGESGVLVFEQFLPEIRVILTAAMDSLPPAKRERAVVIMEEEMRREATPERVVEELIPVYERHLTAEEVKALIAFYESPAGTKFTSIQAQLIKESAVVGEKLSDAAVKRVMKRFEEEGIESPPAKPPARRRAPARRRP